MHENEKEFGIKDFYYLSTRGRSEKVSSSAAIVKGIADDGGLYVPSYVPEIDKPYTELIKMHYRELAFYIIEKFLPDFSKEELKDFVCKAYDSKFDTPQIAPLVKVGDFNFLELHHGATAAFKDMALSLLPYLLVAALKKSGEKKEIVILTATSGDTGKAALESFSNVRGTKIIVFYPDKGVSLVQKQQMITQEGNNTFVCAIKGNFDDAQTSVKKIFSDKEFINYLTDKGYMVSSANSINIGRLIPQVVYYIHAYLRLIENNEIEDGQYINIVVPTGNFGNILAAYYAMNMGLPVQRFLCASNENNILYDFINTGVYDSRRELKLTISPSMDILISSNLERLIFDLCKRDSNKLTELFNELSTKGVFSIDDEMKEKLNIFWGGVATEKQTLEAIKHAFEEYGYLMDTHTAVGYHVYKDYREITMDRTKTVIVSTASPFKFPQSVLKAISPNYKGYENYNEFYMLEKLSEITKHKIPAPLRGLADKKILHNNYCDTGNMKDFILKSLGL